MLALNNCEWHISNLRWPGVAANQSYEAFFYLQFVLQIFHFAGHCDLFNVVLVDGLSEFLAARQKIITFTNKFSLLCDQFDLFILQAFNAFAKLLLLFGQIVAFHLRNSIKLSKYGRRASMWASQFNSLILASDANG